MDGMARLKMITGTTTPKIIGVLEDRSETEKENVAYSFLSFIITIMIKTTAIHI